MNIKLTNQNYCATVVEIKTLIPLENCDNVQATLIMGNQVVVGKNIKIGDIGLFFPVETALSEQYSSSNNIYRNKELNNDKTKIGYFEENRRIRCVKFRGNKSEGLFMPIDSLYFIYDKNGEYPKIGDSFNEFNDVLICEKYISKGIKVPGESGSKTDKKTSKLKNLLIPNQFRFHEDRLCPVL